MQKCELENLIQIKNDISALIQEAQNILRRNADHMTYERAKSYWIAHIIMALDKEHNYLGGSMFTFQDTINELDDDDDK